MLSNAILDFIGDALVKTAAIPWTDVYASLHTASPGTTGANEVAVGGYARQSTTGLWVASSAGVITNNAIVGQFDGAPAGGSAVATHVGLWSALTGGTFIMGGAITPTATISPSESVNFLTGQLVLTLTSAT